MAAAWSKRRTFLKGSALAAGVALLEACGATTCSTWCSRSSDPRVARARASGSSRCAGSAPPAAAPWCASSTATRARSKGCARTRSTTAGCARWVRPRSRAHYDPDRVTGADGAAGAGATDEAKDGSSSQGSQRAARAGRVGRGARRRRRGDRARGGARPVVDRLRRRQRQHVPPRHAGATRARDRRAGAGRARAAAGRGRAARRARSRSGSTTPAAYDLPRADYILSIGPAFLDRGAQPAWATWAMSQVRGGMPGRRGKLVQAEARMSITAAFADEWLPVMPGEEGTLARTIAGVLLAEAPARGDDAAYRAVSPSNRCRRSKKAAKRCDLPAKTIRRIARELAARRATGRARRRLGGAARRRPGEHDRRARAQPPARRGRPRRWRSSQRVVRRRGDAPSRRAPSRR